jgi:hypothetical protein
MKGSLAAKPVKVRFPSEESVTSLAFTTISPAPSAAEFVKRFPTLQKLRFAALPYPPQWLSTGTFPDRLMVCIRGCLD